MITTRWIVHCGVCGYLERPEYPAQWVPEKNHACRFHHKRDAMGVVAQYSPSSRESLLVEPVMKHQEEPSSIESLDFHRPLIFDFGVA